MQPASLFVRLSVVVATLAALLVPAFLAPARSLEVPETIAATVRLSSAGRVPLSFPPTHVAFSWTGGERTGVAYRTIGRAGALSRWRRAPQSHDLEKGDRHYSAVLVVNRPAALEWREIDPRGTGVADVTLDYLNTVDGPATTVEVPATAGAAAAAPDIVTRAEWGADESIKRTTGSCRRDFYKVQQLFVHHTAGTNFDRNPAATMRAIYWYHTVRRGWCDVGYNFVIAPGGAIFEGRWARRYSPWEVHSSETREGYAVAGAHVSGFNSGSVGISVMGNFSQVEPPPEARRSLAELLAWEADRHNLDPTGTHTYRNPESGVRRRLPYIAGHRDAGYTECPGNLLYAALPQVRRDAATVIGAGKASSSLDLYASSSEVSAGDPVTLSGTLRGEDGAGLGAQPITIYKKEAGASWTVAGETATGLDGSYTFTLTPRRKTSVVALYAGDSATWGAQSATVRIRVTADISLSPEGGTPDEGGTSHYPAGTTAVTLAGVVTPAHPGGAVKLLVYPKNGDGSLGAPFESVLTLDRSSAYRYAFPIPEPRSGQSFQAIARFRGDADHAPASSPPVTFTIDA